MHQLRSLGRLFSGIKGVYNEINPATLTGALDIVVIEDEDGTYNCGQFHVRFGKMGTINPANKIVEIYVNGEQVEFLHMRLGNSGKGYFVEDVDAPPLDSDSDSNWSEHVDHFPSNENSLYRNRSAEDLTKGSLHVMSNRKKRRKPRQESSVSETNPGLNVPQFAQTSCLESGSNSPSYMSDNECERNHAEILMTAINDMHSSNVNVTFNFDENLCNQSIVSEPTTPPNGTHPPISPTQPSSAGIAGVYLEDLVASKVDENTKQAYIYVASSQGRHSKQYSSQELNAVDAGYRSDTELNSQMFIPSTSLINELKISLCGGLSADSQIKEDEFCSNLVTFEEFSKDPAGIISNPNLVVLLNGKFYNWNTAAPILLSYICFRTELPYNSLLRLEEAFMPKKRLKKKSWFGWGSSEPDNEPTNTEKSKKSVDTTKSDATPINNEKQNASSLSTHDLTIPIVVEQPPDPIPETSETVEERPKRKITLTSNEIMDLGLKPGANDVEFRIVSKFQGTYNCFSKIYLWRYDDQLVVSDVDGTITRSDLLGHFLPMLGRDWTQDGVAELYTKIAGNGYKFVYLSARAIGQVGVTKSYLTQVRQRGDFTLPEGPILLSPTSLYDAFHREVIEKKPEIFKIECLSKLRSLFRPKATPFYAAFGNRTNDIVAYSRSGFETCRIFTVNPNGLLRNERLPCADNTYDDLIALVDHLFPTLPCSQLRIYQETEDSDNDSTSDSDSECAPANKLSHNAIDMSLYSSFTFWRPAEEGVPPATNV